LSRSFGHIKAVENISFDVGRGETFGLLGPNGAGKTTTINLLLGVLKPDGGSIRIGSVADPTKAEVRKQVGVAPQSLSLYEDLTGAENLLFFGKLYGLTRKDLRTRVGWALDFAGLRERRNDLVSTYSGGMKRRLNLAAGLVHDPDVIFLDEPTVGMDPQSRNLVFERLEELKNLGRTVLYTSHYMDEVQRLCDRVAILERGRILALDTVDALIDRHGGFSIVEVELSDTPATQTALRNLAGTGESGIGDGESRIGDGESRVGDGARRVEDDRRRRDEGMLRIEDRKLRIETDRPLDIIAELGVRGIDFSGLIIHRPNLETVFLNLTGRKLRDE